MAALEAYPWPGNVRELRNVVERAVYRPEQPQLPAPAQSAHIPDDCADLRIAVAEYEKAILAAALEKCRWNQRAAAAALSLTYDQLRHAMRRHELQG
jgi:psp operon transcriptional activator